MYVCICGYIWMCASVCMFTYGFLQFMLNIRCQKQNRMQPQCNHSPRQLNPL